MTAALLFASAMSAQAQGSQDYQETLAMLGISSLRPGADGFNALAPNAANTDESRAYIYGSCPDLMRFKDGRRASSPEDWEARRKELFADFDREIYGKTPKRLPRVSWRLASQAEGTEGGLPVLRRSYVGAIDSAEHPQIKAAIPFMLVTPASARGRRPVIIEFGFPFPPMTAAAEPWTVMAIRRGYGYVTFDPNSVQQDSGAGLRSGIIGMANGGRLRKPYEWGALKAWAWGASRILDCLKKDPYADGRRCAIAGISRYGKAALVTMAYDSRFAAALVGSSGAGGAKLWRRDFGERETNVASSGEYHWMAPNFIRYAGPLTPKDMPVDQHELIALCAPRPVFVGVGSPRVEGSWVDGPGMFQACVLASPAWEMYGRRGLQSSRMPAEDVGLTSGMLAFRKHSGGHTNGPNWPAFLDWFARTVVHRNMPSPDVS